MGWFFIGGGIALAVGAAVAAWLSDTLTRPLRQAQHATVQIAGGDLSTRLPEPEPGAHDEVADLTRSIPVNGRYSKRQRAVYDAVLRVLKGAREMLVPGTKFTEYHKEVGKIMESELLGLGLISKDDIAKQDKDWPAYKKYFMHGTSHHLGLDTHDYGLLHEPMKANMVFTVEPGIYIPEEGFGIRIEDDMVIQEQGAAFNLMRNIPIEVDEIEAIMNS